MPSAVLRGAVTELHLTYMYGFDSEIKGTCPYRCIFLSTSSAPSSSRIQLFSRFSPAGGRGPGRTAVPTESHKNPFSKCVFESVKNGCNCYGF